MTDTRTALLRRSLKTGEVDLGDGETIKVCEISGEQRAYIMRRFFERNGMKLVPRTDEIHLFEPTLVAMGAREEDGSPSFADPAGEEEEDGLADVETIRREVSPSVVSLVAGRISQLSGLDTKIDEHVGNSGPGPSE